MKNNGHERVPASISRFLWGNQAGMELFNRKAKGLPLAFSVRPMDLQLDSLIINHWVNTPYSYNYWQMQGATSKSIADYYEKKIAADLLYPFIISYGQHPITLIELYNVEKDELGAHIATTPMDKGIHTLMAPPRYLLTKLPQKVKNISKEALVTALQFAFSFAGIENMYTEPNIDNYHANELAKQMGWEFVKEIELTDKKANLFRFEKQAFLKQYPMQ